MDNVIEFPKIKVGANVQSQEELQLKLEEFKAEYSNEIAEFLWRNILAELVRSGCDFQDMNKYFPSMLLVLESIRSLHLQAQDIHHNLQDFAIEAISVEELQEFEEKMVDIDEDID
jgi:hypothetical protein